MPERPTPLLARLSVAALCLACLAATPKQDPNVRRTDPDNPGGERVGDDDGPDGFTGYPADPGTPGDAYRDGSSEYRPSSPNWTGAFFGGGLAAGFATVRGDYVQGLDRAPQLGVFLNWASVQQILDVQLMYTRATFHPKIGGAESRIAQQGIHATLLLHPLFLWAINAPPGGYILANIYGSVGVGAEFTNVSAPISTRYESAAWRIGAGFDLPLDNTNDGRSVWLGLQFQRAYVGGAPNVAAIDRDVLRENALMLRLSFRNNGNVFRGFRGPQVP